MRTRKTLFGGSFHVCLRLSLWSKCSTFNSVALVFGQVSIARELGSQMLLQTPIYFSGFTFRSAARGSSLSVSCPGITWGSLSSVYQRLLTSRFPPYDLSRALPLSSSENPRQREGEHGGGDCEDSQNLHRVIQGRIACPWPGPEWRVPVVVGPARGRARYPVHWLVAIEMGRWTLYSGWVVRLAVWWCRLTLEVFKYPRGS